MSFCQKCGKEIPQGANGCVACGAQNAGHPPMQPAGNKLHCPNCKSTNITITTESSVTGAVTTGRGRFSATSFSNAHRNFWICSDCGTKFRNIQNLEEEIAALEKAVKTCTVLSILCIIFSVYMTIQIFSTALGFFMYPILITVFVAAVVTIAFRFKYKKDIQKLQAEMVYLKQHCFD